MRKWFVRWYMGRIAGRYCPCEWPYKSRYLVRVCARIDDANAALDFKDWACWYMNVAKNRTSSSSGDADLSWQINYWDEW